MCKVQKLIRSKVQCSDAQTGLGGRSSLLKQSRLVRGEPCAVLADLCLILGDLAWSRQGQSQNEPLPWMCHNRKV